MKIDLHDGAMIVAEQNLSLLEGQVMRLLGLHVGKLKGGDVAPVHAPRREPATTGAVIH
jgi:branched-chain amino acid transport system ATP-binding protein